MAIYSRLELDPVSHHWIRIETDRRQLFWVYFFLIGRTNISLRMRRTWMMEKDQPSQNKSNNYRREKVWIINEVKRRRVFFFIPFSSGETNFHFIPFKTEEKKVESRRVFYFWSAGSSMFSSRSSAPPLLFLIIFRPFSRFIVFFFSLPALSVHYFVCGSPLLFFIFFS